MQEGISEQDYKRLHPKLVALFRSKGLSMELALELTQETFFQAQKSFANFEQHSLLDTWVQSIGKNVLLHHWRSRKQQKRDAEEVAIDAAVEAVLPANPEPGPEQVSASRERLNQVKEAIKALPELMRRALSLHVQGSSYRKIGELLGTDENRVSSLIHQARSKLRRQFPT